MVKLRDFLEQVFTDHFVGLVEQVRDQRLSEVAMERPGE
jgi:hypothetical protein